MRLISFALFAAAACSNASAEPPAKPRATLSVTKLDPAQGDSEGGTYVRIVGAGFIAEGPRNLKVYFGARAGTVVRFVNDREVIVQAPAGKVGEAVDVQCVFDPGGAMKLAKAFTFVDKAKN